MGCCCLGTYLDGLSWSGADAVLLAEVELEVALLKPVNTAIAKLPLLFEHYNEPPQSVVPDLSQSRWQNPFENPVLRKARSILEPQKILIAVRVLQAMPPSDGGDLNGASTENDFFHDVQVQKAFLKARQEGFPCFILVDESDGHWLLDVDAERIVLRSRAAKCTPSRFAPGDSAVARFQAHVAQRGSRTVLFPVNKGAAVVQDLQLVVVYRVGMQWHHTDMWVIVQLSDGRVRLRVLGVQAVILDASAAVSPAVQIVNVLQSRRTIISSRTLL